MNYRARMASTMDRACEDASKATEMRREAANIEAAAAQAIYSDDVDAVERLEVKIAKLTAERDRIKAYNASCRRGAPDDSLLDDRQRASLESVRCVCAYQLGQRGEMPSYATSNLSATINTARKRLEAMRH